MPYSNNSGGPWEVAATRMAAAAMAPVDLGEMMAGQGGNDGGRRRPPAQRPGQGVPDIDDIVRKGQEQLKVLIGGGGGSGAVVANSVAASPAERLVSLRLRLSVFGPLPLSTRFALKSSLLN